MRVRVFGIVRVDLAPKVIKEGQIDGGIEPHEKDFGLAVGILVSEIDLFGTVLEQRQQRRFQRAFLQLTSKTNPFAGRFGNGVGGPFDGAALHTSR